MEALNKKAFTIKLFVTDLDGVLSDGYLYVGLDETEYKAFHVHDGLGLLLLRSAGIDLAVITTSKHPLVDKRMQQLGIHHYFKGVHNKMAAYEALKQKLQLQDEHIAYVGDDIPDLPILKRVGLSIAVADARHPLPHHVDYQTKAMGGKGAVREACELILRAQGKLDLAIEKFIHHDNHT